MGFEIFPPIELMTIDGSGTWWTVGDSLYLDIEEVEFLIDGVSLGEWLEQVARTFARNLADLSELPDEVYPAFEEEVVQEFLIGLNEEPLTESLDEAGTYTIDGDTLIYTLTDEDGLVETDEYHRVPVGSAVEAVTWGQMKAFRPR